MRPYVSLLVFSFFVLGWTALAEEPGIEEITNSSSLERYRSLKNQDARWQYLKHIVDKMPERYGVKIKIDNLDADYHLIGDGGINAFGQIAQIEDALLSLKFDKKASLQKLDLEIIAFDNVGDGPLSRGRTLYLDTFDSFQWFPARTTANMVFDLRGRRAIYLGSGQNQVMLFNYMVGPPAAGTVDVMTSPFRAANALGHKMFGSKSSSKFATSSLTLGGYKQVTAEEIKNALSPMIAEFIE